MARVRVKFFSVYSDVAEDSVFELRDGVSVEDLLVFLANRYPALRRLFDEIEPIVFINGVARDPGYRLYGDVEVAVFPPVSGG